MGITDKELADFSDFSYVDIPEILREKFERNGVLSIKQLADYYLSDKNPGKFKCDDIQLTKTYTNNLITKIQKQIKEIDNEISTIEKEEEKKRKEELQKRNITPGSI